jgi:RNA polymerase sigma-70 factor, ECF subfamily
LNNLEEEWLHKALDGDAEAFDVLVDFYQAPVFNLCYRMLGNEQEAEDAAQESFWRAYQGIKRFDRQRSFVTWLLSIAAHYCIDQQRRSNRISFSIDDLEDDILPDNSPSPETSAARSEDERRIHQYLRELQPQDRAAMILRYWYDFSDQEIGTTLSLTVSAVKSRLHRARLQLANRWQTASSNPVGPERKHYESPAF